jgi:hypothetical protein
VRTNKVLGLCLASGAAIAACTADVSSFEDEGATSGASIAIESHLSGCHGTASSSIPADGKYYLTSFGGGSDTQPMSCGGTANGTGWYAASRQRFGCGAHVQITANGKCVVVAAQDYGPDVCVENAAGRPIIDASPAVSKALFGTSSAGWSDHLAIVAEEVPTSTPLGPCSATPPDPTPGPDPTPAPGATCNSATLDRDVDDGTCVQSATDAKWYACESGAWVAKSSSSGCASAYGFCASATLGKSVPPRTCVQSAASSSWFQCNGQGWVTPVDTAAETGPIGACSSWNAL